MLNNPEFLYAIFIVFILANLLMLPLGWLAIKVFRQILAIPREFLMPLILVSCVVGSFAINNSIFGVGIMLTLGVIGYLMEENGFPIAPAILGLVLGEMIESHFMTSMIKADGNLLAFFERPLSAVLGIITLTVWVWVALGAVRRSAARVPASAGPSTAG